MENTVAIIGMGEIGKAIYDDIKSKSKETSLTGVEVNKERAQLLAKEGYNVSDKIPAADVYIIAVYTSEQVMSVLREINADNNPLVSIESTINPKLIAEFRNLSKTKKLDIICFPHRFNPDDSDHRVFNLHRVLGAMTDSASQRALSFYGRFMSEELITIVPVEIAALSKIVENACRFMEIVIAQELKRSCDKNSIDFSLLRKAANTKWNISIKEARDGVKGKCLPKDAKILADFFSDDGLLKKMIELNDEYIKESFE